MSNKIIIIFFAVVVLGLLLGVSFMFVGNKDIEDGHEHTDFKTLLPVVQSEKEGDEFTDFLDGTYTPDEQKVINNIHNDIYKFFPCEGATTGARSIMLVGTYKQLLAGNTFVEAQQAVLAFEDELYNEWGQLVFGTAYQSSQVSGVGAEFSITDQEVPASSYRIVKYSDVKTELYYGWVLNYLIISPNQTCLFDTMKSIYDVH